MSASSTKFLTHSRKVCSLYKRAIRNLESWYDRREVFRYEAVLMRERFDKNRKQPDIRKATELLEAGEQELFETQHFQPKKFANSPGGVAFEREVIPPDWILDHWHPLEKAQYPDYFARREKRKQQYVQWWEKTYGKPKQEESHH